MTRVPTAVVDDPATGAPLDEQPAATATPGATAPAVTGRPSARPDPTVATSTPTSATPTVSPTSDATSPAPTATATVSSAPSSSPASPTPTPSPTPEPTATTTAPVWSTPPTVTTSEVPFAVIALALVVLLAATAVIALVVRRARTAAEAPDRAPGGPRTSPADATRSTSDAGTAAPTAGASVRRTPVAVAAARARAAAASDDTTLAGPDVERTRVDTSTLVVADVLAGSGGRRDADEGPREEPPEEPASVDETIRFCLQLGEAMIDTTAPVVQVQDALGHIASANGIPDVEVVALPTALLLSTPRAQEMSTVAVSAGYRSLRLDQVQEVLEVADLARAGTIGPAEGLRRVADAVERRPPYSVWQQAFGYVISAVGLALVLGGSLTDVALAGVLGAFVVGFEKSTARWAVPYQAIVVLVASFVVSAAVFSLSRTGLDVTLLPALVAPLITFLPGAQLTTGVIDLATRQMIAGAARLSAGVMMLVLLALGIVAGANLVGIPASALHAGGGHALGWVGAWVGVGIFGVGTTIRHSAQRRSVPWILLVLVVAYAGQLVGGALLGTQVSAFVGALAMTPVALVVSRYADGPPAMVSILPAFWLLVPGSLGLVGVTSVLGESTDQGLTAVVTAGTTMVAISLGVLTGLGAGSWALASRWWLRRPPQRAHPEE